MSSWCAKNTTAKARWSLQNIRLKVKGLNVKNNRNNYNYVINIQQETFCQRLCYRIEKYFL